jgi:putative tricarboxylic transport membrane protein
MQEPLDRRIDIGVALVLIVIAGIVTFETADLPPGSFEPLGSARVPQMTAGLIILLALLVIGRALLRPTEAGVLVAEGERWRDAAIVAVLTVGYVAAMQMRLATFAIVTTVFLTAVIFTLPLTYYMTPTDAVVLLIAMYVGASTGGLIIATLFRMPGTPSNVMTTFDGYPMAKAGKAGRALGLGIAASFVGGMVSWLFLVLLAKPLSIWATRFGPFEYFTLILMAMVLIASVSQGSLVKGLIAGLLGMLASMPGVDPSAGQPRLTFDWYMLNGGLKLLPVLIGVFAVSQIISDILEIGRPMGADRKLHEGPGAEASRLAAPRRQHAPLQSDRHLGRHSPGRRRLDRLGDRLHHHQEPLEIPGALRPRGGGGIIASEAANNATVGGALVPLIAMGIPGSVIDAILIGALMIHSIQPGPTLFLTNFDVVWAMMAACLVANVLMFVIMLGSVGSVGWVAKLAQLPRTHLLPVIIVFCVVGSFGLDNTMFDVWVMLIFGVIGFLLERARYPLGPFVIGFVLAPLMEEKLRSGLMMTAGSIEPVYTRPLPLLFLLIALLLVAWPLIGEWRRRRQA